LTANIRHRDLFHARDLLQATDGAFIEKFAGGIEFLGILCDEISGRWMCTNVVAIAPQPLNDLPQMAEIVR